MPRKIILLLLIIGGVVLISSNLFFAKKIVPSDNKLTGITIKLLTIDGKNYSLTEGKVTPEDQNLSKVSQLALFYQWLKEDPLFYSPDLNVQGLKEAVDFLDHQHSNLLKTVGQTQHLYPVDFLKELVKSAKLSEQFLANPSDALAQSLLSQYQQTAKQYQVEAQSLTDFITPDAKLNSANSILFNTAINNNTLLSDLKKIAQNGAQLEKEISLRQKCLAEGICQRPALNSPKPRSPKNPPVVDSSNIVDPGWVFDLPDSQVKELQQQKLIRGIYQTSTPCFGLNEDLSWPGHLFYIRNVKNGSDPEREDIVLATDIFFRKLTQESQVAGDQELRAMGLKYKAIPSDNTYMCPYSGYLGEIATLDLFWQQNKPILADQFILSLLNADVRKARQDEKDFFGSMYPSYQQLATLGADYGYLYRLLLENKTNWWVRDLIPLREELLRRYLVIRQKMGQLDLVFNKANFLVEGSDLRVEVSSKEPLNQRNLLYLYRNFYGLYYLPFSPSVWRSGQSLKYLEDIVITGAIDPAGGYLSFHQALGLYPESEIKSWFRDARPILKDQLPKNK